MACDASVHTLPPDRSLGGSGHFASTNTRCVPDSVSGRVIINGGRIHRQLARAYPSN
jgi:hypothetical protein